jgi:serine/threonine protein kinase
VKIMRPHETNNRAEVEREISVLKLLKHPNIVQLFEVIEDENGRVSFNIYITSERFSNFLQRRDRASTQIVYAQTCLNSYVFMEARKVF